MMPPLTEDYAANQAMARLVGATTLTWAAAENALSMTIAMIDKELGPLKGHKELPRTALTRKLDYLKIALREPRLEPVRERGHALIERFMSLKKRRDELTHGIARQITQDQFVSINFVVSGRQQRSELIHFTIEDVRTFLGKVIGLSDEAMIVAALVGRLIA